MKRHVKSFLQVRKATIPESRLVQKHNKEGDLLPSTFTVVVWNIFKRHGGKTFDRDLCDLSARADIACLQEVLSEEELYLPKEMQRLNHNYGISYHRPDGFTEGVLTASHYLFNRHSQAMHSLSREPLTNTPKTTLISFMPMASGHTLLLINLHMLLFKRRTQFRGELEHILAHCEPYQNLPAIFCGDFNTFTLTQMKLLDSILGDKGFIRCRPGHAPRTKRYLDHIYIRRLNLLEMEIIDTISSSDHSPLICRVELNGA